jgi:hypothetical protein
MAKCFTSWTVLPHDPIEKQSENLWTVSGVMPGGNQRRMSVARRADGKLVIHNPIALSDAEMSALEAFGQPAFLIVPNSFHRQDSVIFKQRYPDIAVFCPTAARKRVAELVPVQGTLDELPKDSVVEVRHLHGVKQTEGVLRVNSREGTDLVFNDTLLNMAPTGGVKGLFLAPTGTLSVPRFTRWFMMKNGAELKQDLEALAQVPSLRHVVPGHGDVVAGDPAAALKAAAGRL